MKVIVGLGNPGKKYQNTRHNIGFRAVDALNQIPNSKFQIPKINKKFNSEIIEGFVDDEKVLLVKPLTFMNKSGESVSKILNYYKVNFKDLVIIHDDIDLKLGTVKISFAEGTAGHKGIESITSALGSQNYWRIRVGILSKSKDKIDTERFVSQDFTKKEAEVINKVIEKLIPEISQLLKESFKPKKFSVED